MAAIPMTPKCPQNLRLAGRVVFQERTHAAGEGLPCL